MNAQQTHLEALAPTTFYSRQAEIYQQLLAYCLLDTLGLLRMWQCFKTRTI